MRLACAISISLLLVVPGFAEFAQNDRNKALSYLYSSEKQLLDATANLTPKQASMKGADGHSVLDYIAHINEIEQKTLVSVMKLAKGTPEKKESMARPAQEANDKKLVLDPLSNPKTENTTADKFKPAATAKNLSAATTQFRKLRTKTLDYVRSTSDDLRTFSADYPGVGKLDACQWILALSAQTERYARQIQALKEK